MGAYTLILYYFYSFSSYCRISDYNISKYNFSPNGSFE